jgi:uncharacterized protein (DUF1684 family)
MTNGHEEHDHDDHDAEAGEHEHHHTLDWATELQAMRDDAAHFYVDHFDWRGAEPPAGFKGPRYYPPDEGWRLAAALDRSAPGSGQKVTLATSTGQLREMVQAGDLVFDANGEQRLTAFLTHDSEGYEMLFVPFRDGTSGIETYGAGRYVEVPYEEDANQFELDFNLAYNPSCVYSSAYDCPYPPASNRLTIDIPAGEMLPVPGPAH